MASQSISVLHHVSRSPHSADASFPLPGTSHSGNTSISSGRPESSSASSVPKNGQTEYCTIEPLSKSIATDPPYSQITFGRLNHWLDGLSSSLIEANPAVYDEELIENYLTVTYHSISNKQSVRDIYQTAIPKEAKSHTYLMHAVLAFSAAHLMHTEYDYRAMYEKKARRHQHLGKPLLACTRALVMKLAG